MKMPGNVTRRSLLRNSALGTIAFASGIRNMLGQRVLTAPNIVFIVADDLGYAYVSCYGRPDLRVRLIIDGLAANGVRFLQAYANSAVCSATRTALITGRYQYRLPLGLEEPLVSRDVGFPPEHPTLPSLLKKAGYGTTLVGKWHLGFSEIWAVEERLRSFLRISRSRRGLFTHADGNEDDLWDDDVRVDQMGYLTDLFGSRAVDVINNYAKSTNHSC